MRKVQRHILFPTCQLIVDGQGDTFLELVIVIARKPDNVPCNLQAECDVEIFGNVAFRPIGDVSVVRLAHGLDS
jgi:hypothetical protein